MPAPQSDLQIELPCNNEAPAAIRETIRALDVGWLAGDAMLVASELVTNAVVHSGCTPDDLLHVSVALDQHRLLISVRDPGTSDVRVRLREGEDLFGGMGLRIVEELSRRWGSERSEGNLVWAEIARA